MLPAQQGAVFMQDTKVEISGCPKAVAHPKKAKHTKRAQEKRGRR